ncbi:hypothetical protein E4T48_07771 [Aureobasidium sp. EXF-10727]|nr:hypothetical protein E4T48_07771 [Aureobasidium sp. EXF-10727]
MFANFELSSGGLVAADVKPKRTRTDQGCLPCRRKKKRCDLAKPVCVRCRKSIGSVVCEWPAHAASLASEDVGRYQSDLDLDAGRDPIRLSANSGSSSQTTVVLREKGRSKHGMNTPNTTERVWETPPSPQNSIENCITISLPSGVKTVSPYGPRIDVSDNQLIQITTAFDKAIISPDNGSLDQPASQLCLPLCLQNSSLMHAWLSCGTAFVTRAQPGGIQKALVHYQQAVKGLATALTETGLTSPEWKVAATLLLHTFEARISLHTMQQSMSPRTDEPASMRVAHLSGAHNLVRVSMMNKAPSSMHQVLLLEAYSFRTVHNRLFQPFPSLPYDYIEKLFESMCLPGSPRQDMVRQWRKCPWVGMCAPMFDMGFKLAWLRDRMPLRGKDLIDAISLSTRIMNWRAPVEAPEDLFDVDSGTADTFMMKNLLSAKAWYYGCLFLSHKLLNPSNGPFDPDLIAISRQSHKVFQQMDLLRGASALLLWPIFLLGTGAVTPADQTTFSNAIVSCAPRAGPGTILRTTQLLNWAWASNTGLEAGFLGSDIILRTDILRQFFM